MHRETAKDRGRSRSLVVLLLALALVAVFGMAAQQALALATFNTAEKGIGPCDKCHSMTAVHGIPNYSSQACDVCHGDTATPPLPSACASCPGHAPSSGRAAYPGGTTDGCHGYVAPAQPTIAIDTVTPKSVKLRRPSS